MHSLHSVCTCCHTLNLLFWLYIGWFGIAWLSVQESCAFFFVCLVFLAFFLGGGHFYFPNFTCWRHVCILAHVFFSSVAAIPCANDLMFASIYGFPSLCRESMFYWFWSSRLPAKCTIDLRELESVLWSVCLSFHPETQCHFGPHWWDNAGLTIDVLKDLGQVI